jgi:hypothetical protein
MALRRAMRGIQMPPSRIIWARQAYDIFVFSNFSARPRRQYLKALDNLLAQTISREMEEDVLEVANLTEEGTGSHDCEAPSNAPYDTTEDSNNFVTEELTSRSGQDDDLFE